MAKKTFKQFQNDSKGLTDKQFGKLLDKKGVKRKGKDVSHKKMLSKGGSNKDGYFLESPSKNRSRNGKKKKKA